MSGSGYTEHFLQAADGVRLYYRQYGPGGSAPFDVLCLHGLTRNSKDFEGLARALGTRYRVLTPDLRGRGRSAYDPNWENYQPAKYVEDAFALLQELRIERCVVIGTSLGGLMGMIMGALQPQRLLGLVINDIGPELDPRGVERIRGYAGKLPAVRSWEEAAAQARSIHAVALPHLDDAGWLDFAHRTYRDDGGTFRPDVDPDIARAFTGAASSAPDLWPFFELLAPIPLLTLRGALSDLFSEQTLARMQAVKPDMRVVTVADRGHAPTLDEPECRAGIAHFLTTLEQSAARASRS